MRDIFSFFEKPKDPLSFSAIRIWSRTSEAPMQRWMPLDWTTNGLLRYWTKSASTFPFRESRNCPASDRSRGSSLAMYSVQVPLLLSVRQGSMNVCSLQETGLNAGVCR